MRVIADCGGTKCAWALITGDQVDYLYTDGYNPKINDISALEGILGKVPFKEIEKCTFYGAGMTNDRELEQVRSVISKSTSVSLNQIEIFSDVLAACRALFDNREGITGILGTGSNACLYNGKRFEIITPSLGYILGDDGGGADLGKRLLHKHFYRELTPVLSDELERFGDFKINEVLQRVYNDERPSAYLASLVPFIKRFEDHPIIADILNESFEAFFRSRIAIIPQWSNYEVGLVGGIADIFRDRLTEIFKSKGAEEITILKDPLPALVAREIEKGH